MTNQRLRNLTTGRLHTTMDDIYRDIEAITGVEGVMTHMLPNACRALEPYLRTVVTNPRFWEDVYDQTHTGETDVPPMTAAQRRDFFARFGSLPSPLFGKEIIVVEPS